MNRQTKHVAAYSFCDWEISAAIPQVSINRLQMQRLQLYFKKPSKKLVK